MPIGDSPAKLTKDAKACIQIAFEDLGGVERLIEWANSPGNLGTFYTQIWSKIIPKAVDASLSNADGSKLTINVMRFSEDEPIDDAEVIATTTPLLTVISEEDEEFGDDNDTK